MIWPSLICDAGITFAPIGSTRATPTSRKLQFSALMNPLIRITFCACLLGLIAEPVACAEPITFTTTDGKVYEKVKVTRVELDGLRIETDAGIEKIPFLRLPVDLQKKFGHDPATAAAYAKERQEAATQRAVAEQEEKRDFGIFTASYVLEKGSVGPLMARGRIFLEGAGHALGMVDNAQIQILAVRVGVWRGAVETLPAYKLKAYRKTAKDAWEEVK